MSIADGVQLGVQAAFRASETGGEHPYFEEARRRAVGPQVRDVDLDPLRCRPFVGQGREDAPRPLHKTGGQRSFREISAELAAGLSKLAGAAVLRIKHQRDGSNRRTGKP